MASPSTPPYEWRLTGFITCPKEPKLSTYLFKWEDLWLVVVVPMLSWFLKTMLALFLSLDETVAWSIAVGIVGCCFVFYAYASIMVAKSSCENDRSEYRAELRKYQDELRLLKQKHPLPILEHGNKQFKVSVERVLDELKYRAPHRYREVIGCFPKAEYQAGLRSFTDYEKKASGRADGCFSVDGSGNISHGNGWYTINDYEWFRFVFLHEAGHKITYYESEDYSEEAADEYANKVLVEMGFSQYR